MRRFPDSAVLKWVHCQIRRRLTVVPVDNVLSGRPTESARIWYATGPHYYCVRNTYSHSARPMHRHNSVIITIRTSFRTDCLCKYSKTGTHNWLFDLEIVLHQHRQDGRHNHYWRPPVTNWNNRCGGSHVSAEPTPPDLTAAPFNGSLCFSCRQSSRKLLEAIWKTGWMLTKNSRTSLPSFSLAQ